MDFSSLVCLNFIGLVSLVFLIHFVRANVAFDARWNHCFLFVTFINLLLILFDVLEYIIEFQEFSGQYIVESLAKTICYIINPLLPLSLIFLIKKREKLFSISFILVIINTCVVILLAFLRIVLKEKNIMLASTISQGTISVLIFLFLMFFALQKDKLFSKDEKNFLGIVVIVIISAFLIEVISEYRFLLWNICAICLVLFYLLVHTKMLKDDTLTGFSNRFVFEKDIKNVKGDLDVPVVVFDINVLKETNDLFGHMAGDKLIVSLTKAISSCFLNGKCYRIGGDEFVYIGKPTTEEKLISEIELFKKEIEDEAKIAFGYAFTSKEKSVEETFKEADKNMYIMKRKCKKKKL